MNTYLETKLRLQKKLGQGGFGEVCQAYNPKAKKLIAIKIEKKNSSTKRNSNKISVLHYEFKIMRILSGVEGVPKAYRYFEDPNYRFLSMELLGHSLSQYKSLCLGKLSIKV